MNVGFDWARLDLEAAQLRAYGRVLPLADDDDAHMLPATATPYPRKEGPASCSAFAGGGGQLTLFNRAAGATP